jgi:2,3-bisphosphoglycerate-independent phosphoglycerate mutase
MRQSPIVLCILDGWGYRLEEENNAIRLATTPNWDSLMADHPYTLLDASGLNVGLPEGQMGNSEVGHMCIGSGRVIYQDLPRIDTAIHQNAIPDIHAYQEFVNKLKKSGGSCHLLGLLSPGGVHSHQDHILALAQLLDQQGITTYIHAFLDGRDTAPTSAASYLAEFLDKLKNLPHVHLATGSGRFYAMDRDQRWERVSQSYTSMVEGQAPAIDDAIKHIRDYYSQNISDEFIPPFKMTGYEGMQDGDGLLMANFRADRVRQMLRALLLPEFDGFTRQKVVNFAALLGMSEYAHDISSLMPALFPSQEIKQSLGEVVAEHGLKQLRIAETEKYAHVTFFFNGGQEKPFPGEERCLIPSPKVATYDLKPEMAAFELTDNLVKAIHSNKYDLIVVNYANPDMVGHTGNLQASIRAVEVIDECLGRVMQAIREEEGILLITADHGNIEMMVEPSTNDIHTAHTLNLVPFVIYAPIHEPVKLATGGTLTDIAPTILELMELPYPEEMTGTPLINSSNISDAALEAGGGI